MTGQSGGTTMVNGRTDRLGNASGHGPRLRAALLAGIGLLAATQAAAVTCESPMPLPPPATAPITTSLSNVTIGTANPFTAIANGVLGCDGREGGGGGDGNPAQQGGAAGAVSVTLTGVTIAGASKATPAGLALGTMASARGGAGGVGGFGDAGVSETEGGAGGAGGAAAAVTLSFSGSIDMRSVAQPGIGIDVLAIGGAGGSGTGTANTGIAGTFGSKGGDGAPGAPASATVSGDIIADAAGVYVDASGGAGGPGGDISGGPDLLREITSGPGGSGANGGTATVTYQSGTLTGRTAGVVAVASGGRGGDGGRTFAPDGLTAGAETRDAGPGGNGATATATVAEGASIDVSVSGLTPASLFPYGGAVVAISVGGDGGNGQDATGGSLNARSGSGGNGGVGGTVAATILGSINFDGFSDDGVAAAVDVYSGGGRGGSGGNSTALSGTAGGGGLAGGAGPASLVVGSSNAAASVRAVLTTGSAALVQSIGGGGGGGGTGRGLNVDGGSGAAGGNAGTASAQVVNGRIIADGVGSAGLVIQSVGGGGGVGGDAVNVAIGANLAVGGNGGQGGAGNAVTVTLGTNAIVAAIDDFGDEAVLAQSIGGAGGKGGSAYSTGSGFLSMTIGGDGGTGATAGNVTIVNDGIVTSYGSWGDALKAQSIGGGGGDGGMAISNSFGIVPTAAVAIGGRGGDGGTGAAATISNTANGQVTTYGSNANALVAQSVGGGGGTGGLAVARAVDFTLDPRIPAIAIAVGLGGSGGTGNIGGAATVSNAGFVSTSGEQAYAVLAQSVGGGGGIGGDATAMSYSGGFTDDAMIPPIAVSVALGASGGSGGAGGTVSTSNSGLVLTLGTDAIALVAQSIGGGGGAGGAGDSLAVANDPEDENPDDPDSPNAGKSLGVSISVGGTGGTGGHGGQVTLGNSGRVVTSGDGAEGFYAQSVGGGGGTAGGGTANAGGNTLTVAVGLGASGGAGGDGGTITATNSGAILTRGADATAVYAQSVGGGGGEAGKGASTSGGVDNVAKSAVLFDTIAAGFNVGADVTDVGDGVFKIGAYAEETKGIEEILKILTQPKQTLKSLLNRNLDLSLSIGGQGGAAGHGGAVTLTNSSDIQTWGAQSDGMFAQSVGGGGGRGGTTSSTGSSYDDTRNQVALGVSGGGGAGGDGGTVSVTNATGANIVTRSALAFGIYAQSVGGGGGAGANSQDVNGSLESLSIGFNGRDGGQGKGGAVTVSNDGSITTQGKNGIGIIAQSVGGGGGLVKSMTTDMTFDPDALENNPQGRLFDIHSFNLTFGGGTNSQGDGGAVTVNNKGMIATNLRNAHGILAQSVGGGGGITIGGQLIGRREDGATPPPNTNNGNGGKVIVSLTPGTSIATAGDGAYGVFAQSIGGGGGFAGDLSNISTTSPTLTDLVIFAGNGNGGDVTVNMQNTTIETSGSYAAGVVAQSVGGGGGILAQKGELQIGTGGGTGAGGIVTVGLTNATIRSTGANAPAILAYSNAPASTGGAAIVNIDGTSTVAATSTATDGTGTLGAAIAMLAPTLNLVNNAGRISAASMAAIAAPAGDLTIANSGQISGNIASSGKLTINNSLSATIKGDVSTAGLLTITNNASIAGIVNASGDIGFTQAAGGNITGTMNAGGVLTADNAGTIIGTLSSSGGGTSTIQNQAGGQIHGAIDAFDNLTIENMGSIGATISIGNSGLVQNAPGGSITGKLQAPGNTLELDNRGSVNADLQAGFLAVNTFGTTLAGTLTSNVSILVAGPSPFTSAIFGQSGGRVAVELDAPWVPAGNNDLFSGSMAITGVLRLDTDTVFPSIFFNGGAYTMGEASTIEVVVQPSSRFGMLSIGSDPEADPSTFTFGPTIKVVNAASLLAGDSVSVFASADPQGGNFTNAPPTPQSDSAVVSITLEGAGPNADRPQFYAFHVIADYAAGAGDLSQTSANVAGHLNSLHAANDPGLRRALVTLADTTSSEQAVANLAAISGQSLVASSAIRLEASLAQARALYSCPSFSAGTTIISENSCAWFRVDGSWANRDAEQGYAGYAFDAVGLTIGGQKEFREGWFVGGSIGYQEGALREDGGLARIRSDGMVAALSLKHQAGPLALGFATSLGNAWMDSRRFIPVAGATARARFQLFTWGLHGRAAWRFGGPALYLEPELQLSATFIDGASYRETGAGDFTLDVNDASDWVFNILPGARVGTRIDLSEESRLDLFAIAGADIYRGNDLSADARFTAATGTDRFRTLLDTDGTAARLSAGLRLERGPALELRLQYEGRLSERETWHSAQARLIKRF